MKDNWQHDSRYPWGRVSYWSTKEGMMTAVGSKEEATDINLELNGQYPEFRFKADQQFEIDKLITALNKAVEVGKSIAKREIRDVLGVEQTRW